MPASLRLAVLGSVLGLLVLVGCKPGASAPPPTPTATPVATHPPALRSTSAVAVPTEVPPPAAVPAAAVLRPAAQASPTPVVTQALKAPLRLAFVAGVARRYTLTLRTSVESAGQKAAPASASLGVEYEVFSVQPDGGATVRASVGAVSGTADGLAELSGAALRVRLAPDGTYTDTRVERDGRLVASGPDADRLARNLMVFPFLNGPLYIGDSFDRRLDFSTGPSIPDTSLAVRYTLAEVTQQDGRELARIDAAGNVSGMTIPSAGGVEFSNGRAQVRGSDYVNTADGWPTSGESSMTLAVDARSMDGQVSGSVTARVEQSYRLESSARGVTI